MKPLNVLVGALSSLDGIYDMRQINPVSNDKKDNFIFIEFSNFIFKKGQNIFCRVSETYRMTHQKGISSSIAHFIVFLNFFSITYVQRN